MHWLAYRELRRNYKRRGVWIYLRHEGLSYFLRHPREIYLDACSMSSGNTFT